MFTDRFAGTRRFRPHRFHSLALAAYLPLIALLVVACGGGAVGADVPPVGSIWFGTSFDPSSFAMQGRASTATTGSTVALVAHLPRSVSGGEVALRVTVDGQPLGTTTINFSGSGELVGLTYTLAFPGAYAFTVADVGGNALASGTLTAT